MEATGPPPDGDVNRGPLIIAVSFVEFAFALLLVVLRFYTRIKLVRKIGLDDWLVLAALVLAIACTSIITAEVHFGTGRHGFYLNDNQLKTATKLNWVSQPFSIASTTCGKISVAVLILRIMARNKPRERFLYCLIGLLLIINFVTIVFIYAQCTPVTLLWEPKAPGHCWNPKVQQYSAYFQSSFACLTDFILALFPLIFIWKLQIRRVQKIGLSCAMSLGVFCGIAALVKTIKLQQLIARSDFTFDTTDLIIWFTTENFVIIIAASVPTLRPLYRSISKKVHTYMSKDSKASESYGSSSHHGRKHFSYKSTQYPLTAVKPSHGHAHGASHHAEALSNVATDREMNGDGESQEFIIPMQDKSHIKKTTEVDVNYDYRAPTDNSRYATPADSVDRAYLPEDRV